MLSFDDPRWGQLRGGYRTPYDPRKALLSLQRGTDVSAVWSELWEELHHQGDVGEASYATVPHLVRIHGARDTLEGNGYAFAVVIERARREHENPEMPPWLSAAYRSAWQDLVDLAFATFGWSTRTASTVPSLRRCHVAKACQCSAAWPCWRSKNEGRCWTRLDGTEGAWAEQTLGLSYQRQHMVHQRSGGTPR